MKTIKSLIKLFRGYSIEPGDQRRIDNLMLNVKSAFFTILCIVIIVLLLAAGGAFDE